MGHSIVAYCALGVPVTQEVQERLGPGWQDFLEEHTGVYDLLLYGFEGEEWFLAIPDTITGSFVGEASIIDTTPALDIETFLDYKDWLSNNGFKGMKPEFYLLPSFWWG